MDTLMKTLVSDLYEMFSLGTSSDFEIHIQDRTIKAHKSVLITRNSYFKCLLESNMVEVQENAVKIDEDYDSFKVFLKYLYTGQLDDDQITDDLLVISDKYLDKTLKKICEEKLCRDVDVKNAAERLIISVLHQCNDLKNAVSLFIAENFDEVKRTPQYKLIHKYEEAVDILFTRLNSILLATKGQLDQSRSESSCKFMLNVPSNLCDTDRAFDEHSTFVNFKNITWTVRVSRLMSSAFESTALFYVISKCDNPPFSNKANIVMKIISSKPSLQLLNTNLDCRLNSTILTHESIRLSALRPYIENGIIKVEITVELYRDCK